MQSGEPEIPRDHKNGRTNVSRNARARETVAGLARPYVYRTSLRGDRMFRRSSEYHADALSVAG
jgi:hypothetical protein